MLQRWCTRARSLLLTIHHLPRTDSARGRVPRGPLSESEIVFLLKSGVTPVASEGPCRPARVDLHADASTARDSGRRCGRPDPGAGDSTRFGRRSATPRPAQASHPRHARPPRPPQRQLRASPSAPTSRQKPDAGELLQPAAALVRGGPRGDFFMARHETSNAELRRYCRQMGVKPPKSPYREPSNYPVVNVTWFDAVAYTRSAARS